MHFARLKLDCISHQKILYVDKELAGSPAMVSVDNRGRFFFSQTSAVGFVLQGKGIKIVLENLRTFLTGICQVGFISCGTSHLYFRQAVSASP